MSDITDTPGEVTGDYTDVHRGGNGTMLLKSKIFLLMLLTAWIANVADSTQAEIVHENHLFPDFCPEHFPVFFPADLFPDFFRKLFRIRKCCFLAF